MQHALPILIDARPIDSDATAERAQEEVILVLRADFAPVGHPPRIDVSVLGSPDLAHEDSSFGPCLRPHRPRRDPVALLTRAINVEAGEGGSLGWVGANSR